MGLEQEKLIPKEVAERKRKRKQEGLDAAVDGITSAIPDSGDSGHCGHSDGGSHHGCGGHSCGGGHGCSSSSCGGGH